MNVILNTLIARTRWINTVPKVMINFIIVKMTFFFAWDSLNARRNSHQPQGTELQEKETQKD